MFWEKLKFPIIGLSPMDGVTDAPMRFMAKKHGQADVIYTEFVSADGLCRLKAKGDMENKIWKDLIYDQTERPVIAQLFGADPEAFLEAGKIVLDIGFDGVDINMGCPSPGLEKRGGGAGLIRDQGRARAVIEATREAVKGRIPVSAKTRIGSAKPDESWWKFLADMKLPALAMHGRTFKQLYSGEADWEILFKAGEVIRENGALFLPNGDAQKVTQCRSDTERKRWGVELKNGKTLDLTGKADGVLIGRQAMGNPWVLRRDGLVPSVQEKLRVMVEHAYKYEEVFNRDYNQAGFQFFPMRKHLACYARGFEGSVALRKVLMAAESAEQVELAVADFLG